MLEKIKRSWGSLTILRQLMIVQNGLMVFLILVMNSAIYSALLSVFNGFSMFLWSKIDTEEKEGEIKK